MTATTSEDLPLVDADKGIALKPLPLSFRAVGGMLDLLRWKPFRLDPDAIVKAASKRARLPPNLPESVLEGLDQLCRSVHDEADLHWFGRANLWELAVGGLASRLRLDALYAADPALNDTPMVPPLIVTGLPRSGTTFLHRLLSNTDQALPVRFFEHVEPVRPRGLDTRRVRTELNFWPWKRVSAAYDFDSIHYVRPGEPDECELSLCASMRSTLLWSMAPVTSYMKWLLDQDMGETYLTYRRALLCRQREAPGHRLTLKCPAHVAFLPALFGAFPDAMVVQTHRAPENIAASACSLMLTSQATNLARIDWRRTVGMTLDKVTTYARRSAAFADTETGARIHHVDYRRLVSEPERVAREIHEHFGLDFDDRYAESLASYTRANRQHKHGRHRYSLEKYELDPADVKQRFSSYRERFADWLS